MRHNLIFILKYGLNLPILNCKDSYTVWYNTKDGAGMTNYKKRYPTTPFYLEKDVYEEIGRVSSMQPAFINVSIPHRPEVHASVDRIAITTRFTPEIHDYDFDRLDFYQ